MVIYIIIALLGIIIGSFLNVCIYRIPKRESIHYPGSHCMTCSQPLKAFDLIPVLSYLWLRGKCRYCHRKISIQYPLIEMINGLLYLLIYYYFGMSILAVAYGVLFSTLLIIAVIDYYTMRIPNSLIIFGTSIGVFYLVFQSLYIEDIRVLLNGVMGMFVGAGIIGLIMLFSLLVFKKEGMGMGDLKLLAMIGLFTGSRNVLYTIFLAVVAGGCYATVILIRKKQEIFPFGPFLSGGAVIAILWGDALWRTYINFML